MSISGSVKVSVLMITFNHEQFIEQAVDSVLAQRTTFSWELLVGEDCSTDHTRDILHRFQQKYPDRIRLLIPPANIGFRRNVAEVLSNCRGEYVALLEGDDFWTSPHKLQMQVDYLDAHPECAICFHRVISIDDSGIRTYFDLPRKGHPRISTIEDLLRGNFMHTCSVVFRRDSSLRLPRWFFWPTTLADWSLHVLNARRGAIAYLEDPMATYRIHGGGVWSTRSDVARARATLLTLLCLTAELRFRYVRESLPLLRDLLHMMVRGLFGRVHG